MGVGLEETRRTSVVVSSTSPPPGPDSDAISDIDSLPSSHHSRVTHVSDTQASRVLDTPHEESQDMTTLDWDADYEMSGDEEEGLDRPKINPAEWILELVDTEFAKDKDEGARRLQRITGSWAAHGEKPALAGEPGPSSTPSGLSLRSSRKSRLLQPLHLLHRSWIKSYRDLVAYWILHRDPVTAWSKYCDVKPIMKSDLHALQFERSFNYMSVDLANVQRDWNKVTAYSRRLGIVSEGFQHNMTNEVLSWTLQDQDSVDADARQ